LHGNQMVIFSYNSYLRRFMSVLYIKLNVVTNERLLHRRLVKE